MKKSVRTIISAVLCSTLILSLAACGGEKKETKGADAGAETTAAAADREASPNGETKAEEGTEAAAGTEAASGEKFKVLYVSRNQADTFAARLSGDFVKYWEANYQDQFETVKVAEPLLGEVGADASVVNEDKAVVAEAILAAAVADAGYGSLAEAQEDGAAFVFLGHGTSHAAKVSYSQMQTQLTDIGCVNAFIGTVEGEPEETSCEAVIEAVTQAGYKKVILRPLMVVAGDHANNDMAGEEEDSWLSMFNASGNFESVDVQITGLGSIDAIQKLYVEHTAAVLED